MAAFDAQRAVRMDAEQLNDYLGELFNWSKEMKAKKGGPDQVARQQQPERRAAASQTPVNSAASGGGGSGGGSQEAVAISEQRHPAAHTYENYRAKWEKFDVDAALAAVDGEHAGSSGGDGGTDSLHSPNSTPAAARSSSGRAGSAPVDIPQARVTVPVSSTGATGVPAPGAAAPTSADGWKDAGNTHFKAGRLQQAVDSYTRSLALQPGCLAYANRAMAQLKLGRHAEAEADCTEAVRIDPHYVKAYQRRATARRQLGNLLGAVEGCESVLRLEPNNRQAAADRAEWVAELLAKEGLQPPSRWEALPVAGGLGAIQAATTAAGVAGAVLAEGTASARDAQMGAGLQMRELSSTQLPRAVGTSGAAADKPAAAVATVATVPAVMPVAKIQVVHSSVSAGADGEEEEAVPDLPAEEFAAPTQLPVQAAEQQQAVLQQLTEEQGVERAQPAVVELVSKLPVQEQQAKFGTSGAAAAAPQAALEQPHAAQAAQQSPAAGALPTAEPVATPAAQEAAAPGAPAAQQAASAAPQAVQAPARPPTAVRGLRAPASVAAQPARVPRTGVEFEKGWKALKSDQQRQAAYLLALQPAALPGLLRQALTPALLAAAAATLLGPGLAQAPEAAAALLEALPGVPRFDLNLLSVPPKQRAELAREWDAGAAALAQRAAAGADGSAAEVGERLAAARHKWKL